MLVADGAGDEAGGGVSKGFVDTSGWELTSAIVASGDRTDMCVLVYYSTKPLRSSYKKGHSPCCLP